MDLGKREIRRTFKDQDEKERHRAEAREDFKALPLEERKRLKADRQAMLKWTNMTREERAAVVAEEEERIKKAEYLRDWREGLDAYERRRQRELARERARRHRVKKKAKEEADRAIRHANMTEEEIQQDLLREEADRIRKNAFERENYKKRKARAKRANPPKNGRNEWSKRDWKKHYDRKVEIIKKKEEAQI